MGLAAKVCFDLFGDRVARLLEGSRKVRALISTIYPYIILDEFQDTNADQWRAVRALGQHSTLLALADPEQRIFDFIGADPERLDHFRGAFDPVVHDLAGDNHRSKGTDIAAFGNDILTGKFREGPYPGIVQGRFASNANQAFAALVAQVLQARTRLINGGKRGWSLAILVPTKRLTRFVSDRLREPFNNLPPIVHAAAVDMDGPILAAEVISFLLQPNSGPKAFDELVGLLRGYFHGKGGGAPSKVSLELASRLNAALVKWNDCIAVGKAPPGNSMLHATFAAFQAASAVALTGDPDKDWRAIRAALEASECPRLKEIANDVRNVRLLERGTQLRDGLARDWRETGAYSNALAIIRQAFVQEHFASANRPESGVVVMNMHKAQGKQFDEVIIFEGSPVRVKGKIVANPDRIVRENTKASATASARQNFRVSVTRAKSRTTILSPADDPCVLLLSD
jgi:DNA helicase-2/ATP-dependent DNA helicase PcrA